MLFRGLYLTYNCLIDGCCKTNRIGRALELFNDMEKRGCVPTYNSFIRYFSVTNEIERAIEMMRTIKKVGHGIPGSSSTLLLRPVEQPRLGLVPRDYTYKLVLDALSSEGIANTLDEELHKKMKEGIEQRYTRVMKTKPVMARKEVIRKSDFHKVNMNRNSATDDHLTYE